MSAKADTDTTPTSSMRGNALVALSNLEHHISSPGVTWWLTAWLCVRALTLALLAIRDAIDEQRDEGEEER